MVTPVRLRQRAEVDISEATEWYLHTAGSSTALRFVDAVEFSVGQIARNPHLGSQQFAVELGIPDLRVWPLHLFPHLVIYVASPQEVDVWRVIHPRRDLARALLTVS